MRGRLTAAGGIVVLAAVAWAPLHNALRGSRGTDSAKVEQVTLRSRLLHRDLHELLIVPRRHSSVLLVFLHGRSSGPHALSRDPLFEGLRALGPRAPVVLLADGGDHSYWHDRGDGPWGSMVLREAIPDAVRRSGADPHRVAIGGVSMGGFGALDLARLAPRRFCAVGGHSAALWFSGGDTPAGAFDDAGDFARNDVLAAARTGWPNRRPLWLDVGTADPFRQTDTALASRLRADGVPVTFHVWPDGHGPSYWDRHMRQYLAFYAGACG